MKMKRKTSVWRQYLLLGVQFLLAVIIAFVRISLEEHTKADKSLSLATEIIVAFLTVWAFTERDAKN